MLILKYTKTGRRKRARGSTTLNRSKADHPAPRPPPPPPSISLVVVAVLLERGRRVRHVGAVLAAVPLVVHDRDVLLQVDLHARRVPAERALEAARVRLPGAAGGAAVRVEALDVLLDGVRRQEAVAAELAHRARPERLVCLRVHEVALLRREHRLPTGGAAVPPQLEPETRHADGRSLS